MNATKIRVLDVSSLCLHELVFGRSNPTVRETSPDHPAEKQVCFLFTAYAERQLPLLHEAGVPAAAGMLR